MSKYINMDGAETQDPDWVDPEGGALATLVEFFVSDYLEPFEQHNLWVAGTRLMAPVVRIATALERIAVALEAKQ